MTYRRRKCRCCREWFLPQAHNAYHQRYCTEPNCKRASKRASQRKWLRKNLDHYRGDINVGRVRAWRAQNPLYSRNRPRIRCLSIRLQNRREPSRLRHIRLRIDHPQSGALQDLSFLQPPDAAKLILKLTCALQDLIGVSAACCYC